MKKVFLLFIASFLFLSCSNDDEAVMLASITEDDVVGRWEVVHLEKNSSDSTENLSGFVFEFKENNELLITNESESFTIEGSWSVLNSKRELQILIPTKDEPLRMFHNEWDVNSLSGLNISLSGLSNNLNGDMQHVNFEKL
jgi:hypothetical protein